MIGRTNANTGINLAKIPEFTYSGVSELIREDEKNWKIKFKTSGTLIISKLHSAGKGIDLFMVGGGGGGSAGGGGGGYTLTQKNILLATDYNYSIVIGAGGAGKPDNGIAGDGGTSHAFDYSVAGGHGGYGGTGQGKGGDGGSGGGGYGGVPGGRDGENGVSAQHPGGIGQGTTTAEFGDSSTDFYAGGGGGQGSPVSYDGGGNKDKPNGTANTGGGGCYNGSGGSGIVIIRNGRSLP